MSTRCSKNATKRIKTPKGRGNSRRILPEMSTQHLGKTVWIPCALGDPEVIRASVSRVAPSWGCLRAVLDGSCSRLAASWAVLARFGESRGVGRGVQVRLFWRSFSGLISNSFREPLGERFGAQLGTQNHSQIVPGRVQKRKPARTIEKADFDQPSHVFGCFLPSI